MSAVVFVEPMPKPPCRAGNASKSLSMFLDGSLPVMAGTRPWCRIRKFSNGCNSSLISGLVLARHSHLLAKPCTSAQCATCGWVWATLANVSSFSSNAATLSSSKFSVNLAVPRAAPRSLRPCVVICPRVVWKIRAALPHRIPNSF